MRIRNDLQRPDRSELPIYGAADGEQKQAPKKGGGGGEAEGSAGPKKMAKKGEKLPDGSVLVAEIYAAQKDADGDVIESAIGRRVSGEFKAIALMERKAGWDAQYSDDLKVGDWEFELFSTAGKNLNKDTTGCRQCHAPLGDSDYLFSGEHMAAVK